MKIVTFGWNLSKKCYCSGVFQATLDHTQQFYSTICKDDFDAFSKKNPLNPSRSKSHGNMLIKYHFYLRRHTSLYDSKICKKDKEYKIILEDW